MTFTAVSKFEIRANMTLCKLIVELTDSQQAHNIRINPDIRLIIVPRW